MLPGNDSVFFYVERHDEKLLHFSRERMPERVAHDVAGLSQAKLFSEVGKQTATLARFCAVGGARRWPRYVFAPGRLVRDGYASCGEYGKWHQILPCGHI